MDSKQSIGNILMLPWLAHGHISPFLELAKRLVTRNFHVYICSTAINLSSIEKKISDKFVDSIELIELQLPSSPELPPHYHTTNGLPPRLMIPLKIAYETAAPDQFADIVTNLRPDFVIYDFNQPWAAEIASAHDIPAVQFFPAGATVLAYGLHMLKKPGEALPFSAVHLRDYERRRFWGEGDVQINDHRDGQRFLEALERSYKILLINSCREIEGECLDVISSLLGKKVIPVGPVVQDPADEDLEPNELIQWLDKKEKGSVVFVSFGSEYFLTKEERNETARGLELSNVNFIWVVRFPNGENISMEEALPEGFLGRTKNRGKVVQGWAPQARILKHPSVGGFVSHCGWNSVMESMKFGVPIIAMPMHIDQPFNARIVEAVGIGLEAIRDDNGKLQGEEIAKTIRKVVMDEDGEDVRRKTREMCEKLNKKGDEEIDSLVVEILELCKKNNTHWCEVLN